MLLPPPLRCVLQDAATARLAIHAKSMKEEEGEEEEEEEERVARTDIRQIGCLRYHAYKSTRFDL